MEAPPKLFRNTELQYAKAFVEEGEMMFRPLSYFKKIEGPSRDEHEGKILLDAEGAKIYLRSPNSTIWAEILGVLTVSRSLGDVDSDCLLIKCFSQTRKTNAYGQTTIEIFNAAGFLEFLSQSLSCRGIHLNHGAVSYYSSNEYLTFDKAPSLMWLHKGMVFHDDEEYRLSMLFKRELLQKYSLSSGVKICVGSLDKFARVLPAV